MTSSYFLSPIALLCALACTSAAAAAPPEVHVDIGWGASSFATSGGTSWDASSIRRDRYDVGVLHRWLGGYLAYSKGLEDPGTKHTRWIQKDVELGALWTFAAWRTSRAFAGLTLGLGGIHSWLRSGSTMDYEPLLLVLGSGGGPCSEPVSGTALSSCSSGATFEGTGWGFTPSVLGTFGAAEGVFMGLRFAGRYLWVDGTNTPSSAREHELLFVVGWANYCRM